jgi:hypothetical protein
MLKRRQTLLTSELSSGSFQLFKRRQSLLASELLADFHLHSPSQNSLQSLQK